MKVVKLSPSKKEYHAQSGDLYTFAYNEHVSVGYTADFEIENQEVLGHHNTDTAYQHPERLKDPKITGADSATTTFTFEAREKGTTLLFIRKYFRFELEEEFQFRITVV